MRLDGDEATDSLTFGLMCTLVRFSTREREGGNGAATADEDDKDEEDDKIAEDEDET